MCSTSELIDDIYSELDADFDTSSTKSATLSATLYSMELTVRLQHLHSTLSTTSERNYVFNIRELSYELALELDADYDTSSAYELNS